MPRGRSGTRRPSTSTTTLPQGARSAAAAAGGAPAATPGTVTSASPTARVERSRAEAPRGNRDATTVIRKARARTGRGSVTLPSAATRSAGVAPPAQVRRTAAGRRMASREGSSRRRETVWGRAVRHDSHGYGELGLAQMPTHDVSPRRSKALDAR